MIAAETYYEEKKWLLDAIHRRNAKFKNWVMAVTGDPGATKSYFSLYWAEQQDPDFDVQTQCVWLPKTFWKAIKGLPFDSWRTIVWDDPTAGLGQREWYLPLNREVTKFIQTGARYKKKNITFPLPAYEILDKAARKVTGYEAQMKDVGLSKLYRCKPNRFGFPEVWKSFLGEATAKIPKCASAYEKMRDEFIEEYFTEEKFEEEEKHEPGQKSWVRIYEAVKANPELYKEPMYPRNPEAGKKWSITKITALLDCSYHTARKVTVRIDAEASGQLTTAPSSVTV